MRWFHKPETLPFSPFVTLLKIATDFKGSSFGQMRRLLSSIVKEHEILQAKTSMSPLDALIACFAAREDEIGEPVLGFLDNCLGRLAQRPPKYLDDLREIQTKVDKDSETAAPTSLLLIVLAEQWPFTAKLPKKDAVQIAGFIVELQNLLVNIGEHKGVINALSENMQSAKVHDLKTLQGKLGSSEKALQTLEKISKIVDAPQNSVPGGLQEPDHPATGAVLPFESEELPVESDNHPELTRWMQKDLEDAVVDGAIGDLIMCLCSKHKDIRLQAVQNLRKLIAKVKESSYSEKDQLWLALGELLETVQVSYNSDQSLPCIAGVFTSYAIKVIGDPLHILYEKINRFLNRGPSWDVDRLPSYWVDKIILNPPDDDDAYHKEIHWLLEVLTDALRTEADLNIFCKRGVFERVLALYESPVTSSRKVKELVLRLLFRASVIPGASTTLVTRFGMMAWIVEQVSKKDEYEGTLKRLARRLNDTYTGRIGMWSKGSAGGRLIFD